MKNTGPKDTYDTAVLAAMDELANLADEFKGVNLPPLFDHVPFESLAGFNSKAADTQKIFGKHVEVCTYCQRMLDAIKP